ncbi:MAG: DUF5777 family beta-barrel protein [Cyclobacteriaceae bacterium]
MRLRYYSMKALTLEKLFYQLITRATAVLSLVACSFITSAQENLFSLLDDDEGGPEPVTATFKGSRVILGHSVKTKAKGELEFLITHRFGRLNSGAHNLWGLDNSSVRLGLEYGISDRFNIGIGRSSFDKSFDGFLKYKAVQQMTEGAPVSVVAFTSMAIKTTPRESEDPTIEFKDRVAYTYQVIIGRKFNSNFSFQLAPTIVNRNLVNGLTQENTVFALGMGLRQKLTQSLALNLEYYYRFNEHDNSPSLNSVSIGFDIETGGHVFQLHLTNSIMTIERSFITETEDDFWDGDIHFGFNISRTFQLDK